MTISEDDFRKQCQEFVERCRELSDDWFIRQSEELSRQDGDLASPLMLMKNELRKTPKGEKICSYEYTVIYSQSYQVPVMYFCASDQNGCPVDVEEVIISKASDLSRVINQVEHPILFRPFYMIHPCRTESFMQSIQNSNKDGYLVRSQSRPQLDKFRLLLLGDTRAYIPVWADAVLRFAETANNVAGIAYTCNNQPNFQPYDNLVYATKRYPNKYLLATQGSNHAQIKLGNWQYAENYATEIVKNLEFGSVGWIDFNMALNLEGGPCISDRFKSDASVLVDPKRGVYYRNPMYYAIGHLSRYVKPGSIRVKVDFLSSAHMFANQYIAFVTPDNYLVVFVANNNIGPMPVNIGINKRTKVQTLLDTKSFNTFIFRL